MFLPVHNKYSQATSKEYDVWTIFGSSNNNNKT